jgi:genome maintenance exonuclease 1
MSRVNENGSRLYQTPAGEKLASVTTILDKTKSAEQIAALENWRRNVGAAKAAEITSQAASRGTRMHKFLEDYICTGVLPDAGSNPYSQISRSMASEIVSHGFKHIDQIWGTEVALYYPGLYAGTTDCVGVWKGSEAILDFKQSNKPKNREWISNYFHQLAAYALAHNKLFNTNISTGVILMCVKPKTNSNLEIIESGMYQEFVIELDEFDKFASEWWDKVEEYYIT